MLQVTEAAIKKIKDEIQEISPDAKDPYIRLHMGIGWGGPRLQLALEESATVRDKVTEIEGINFMFDVSQSSYFNNVKLDYTKNLFGMGQFQLLNV